MNRRIWLYLSIFSVFLIWGCGTKVMVPPEIDLKEYGSVGIVDFSSDAEGNLGEFMTQEFLAEISLFQKGVGIVELGSMDEVLKSVRQDRLNPEAIKAIGQKHNLNSIITGNLSVSDIKPNIDIAAIVSYISVEAEAEASLTVKLLETQNGATIWTDSAQGKENVADVSVLSANNIHFDARDPEEAYGDLAKHLVEEVTEDLRISWK